MQEELCEKFGVEDENRTTRLVLQRDEVRSPFPLHTFFTVSENETCAFQRKWLLKVKG